MRIASVILSVLLCFFQSAFAQYGSGKPEKIKLLEERPLIVITEVESAKTLALLKKKKKTKQIELYKKAVEDYNVNLKEVVNKFWKFNSKVTYMTYDEAYRLCRDKKNYYSVLYCATVENYQYQGQTGGRIFQGLEWSKIFGSTGIDRDYWDTYTVMQIKLIEELDKNSPIYSQNLANILPEKSDLVFGLQTIQYYANGKAAGKEKAVDLKDVVDISNGKLAKKTLLLQENWLNISLSSSEIQSTYPYPFAVVDKYTFNNQIFEADTSYAYVQIVPQVNSAKNKIKISYLHLIIDAADGTMLGISTPGLTDNGSKTISKTNLKDYTSYARK